MVDEWETGERVPTKEQIQALARLTGFSIDFFYLPPPPPMAGVFLCSEDGCETPEHPT
jgi:transcriptional regulator with XRE-family HTH domain